MKTYKTTVYEKSDIDKLENMTNAEIADVWSSKQESPGFSRGECQRLIEALVALSKAAEILRKTSEL